jgi:RHH-type proline utilization regulon transcriptional repressor/proline dehydrogenase/delta 1-pyrroline-5-carboxylate dehydrogenase
MIVDATALPEQVVRDALISAFQSAGQRCSALRLLCLQADIADDVLAMLRGAMDALITGDPRELASDLGPVIDGDALAMLEAHLAAMQAAGHKIHRAPAASDELRGHYFAPALVELDDPAQLEREVFGPILHVVRWRAADLDRLIDSINARGYGLTLGVHSRIDATVARVRQRAKVGNLYANRSTIGAVVGVQPFGGEGLSGTGPKAGGPRYLYRFATERHVSIDTTASGGNASLLALGDG